MSQHWDRMDILMKRLFERMKGWVPEPESCPDEEMVAAYWEGRLTREEADRIEVHLASCKGCTDKLILLSEMEASCSPAAESLVTEQMVQKAKSLVGYPDPRSSLAKRIGRWLKAVRPLPAFVTASVVGICIASMVTFYLSGGRNQMTVGVATFGITASVPTTDLTRANVPIYREIELEDGAVLRSGDRFKIEFQLQEGAYAVLLALNSQGHVCSLWPRNVVSSNAKAEAGVTYFVPSDDEWFELDDNRGVEKIYLLISVEPIEGLENKIRELAKSGIANIADIFSGAAIHTFSFRHE